LFITNSAIFQQYHGENKLICNAQLKNDYAVCKQQSALLEEDLLDQRQEITEFEKKIK
jgi:hypothetical protein